MILVFHVTVSFLDLNSSFGNSHRFEGFQSGRILPHMRDSLDTGVGWFNHMWDSPALTL